MAVQRVEQHHRDEVERYDIPVLAAHGFARFCGGALAPLWY
jgi:hypothetical protein